jgi:hypothetical protein
MTQPDARSRGPRLRWPIPFYLLYFVLVLATVPMISWSDRVPVLAILAVIGSLPSLSSMPLARRIVPFAVAFAAYLAIDTHEYNKIRQQELYKAMEKYYLKQIDELEKKGGQK